MNDQTLSSADSNPLNPPKFYMQSLFSGAGNLNITRDSENESMSEFTIIPLTAIKV